LTTARGKPSNPLGILKRPPTSDEAKRRALVVNTVAQNHDLRRGVAIGLAAGLTWFSEMLFDIHVASAAKADRD